MDSKRPPSPRLEAQHTDASRSHQTPIAEAGFLPTRANVVDYDISSGKCGKAQRCAEDLSATFTAGTVYGEGRHFEFSLSRKQPGEGYGPHPPVQIVLPSRHQCLCKPREFHQ